jgi:DNA-binding transcriptional LysR family regulator
VTLVIADTEEIHGRVLEGACELGVIGSKSSHKSILNYELWKDELVLAVPAKHRWAKRKRVRLEELYGEPFILREQGSGTQKILEDYLVSFGSKGTDHLFAVARFGSSTAVKEGIKAGLGVSILSLRALDTEIETGILKALRLNGLSMSRRFYLIRDKRRIVSPLCQGMMEFLLASSQNQA